MRSSVITCSSFYLLIIKREVVSHCHHELEGSFLLICGHKVAVQPCAVTSLFCDLASPTYTFGMVAPSPIYVLRT